MLSWPVKKDTGGAWHDDGRKSARVRLSKCDGVGSIADLVFSRRREVRAFFKASCSPPRGEGFVAPGEVLTVYSLQALTIRVRKRGL